MTVKPFFLVVTSDAHQSYESMRIVATATKDTDAQKLYSKALKEKFDDVVSVYRCETGKLANSGNIFRDADKLYSSNGN